MLRRRWRLELFSDYRGIPWQARLLIYLSFIPNIAIGFIYTDLGYFLITFQGIGPTQAGFVITVMGLTLVVESIPLGIVADKFGRRKMLILGNLCASLSLLGFALTTNYVLILLVAVLEGTGEAAYAVSVSALLAGHAGDEKRTAAFSFLSILGWIASAVGAAVISSVVGLENFGFDLGQAHVILFAAVGLLNLSITPLLWKISEGPSYEKPKGWLPRRSGSVLAKYLTYSVLIAVGAGLFVPIMTVWFNAAYGVPDDVSGLVLAITSILTAGVVVISPRLARRFGLVKATVVTQASSTAFMLAVPFAPTFSISATFYVVRVFMMNLSNPLTQSLIMGLIPVEERGMASGITASLWRLPNSLSTTVGLTWIGAGLVALPFYVATALYVVGISIFWALFRNAKLPEELPETVQEPAQSSSLEGPEVER
jgi:MFS family permease